MSRIAINEMHLVLYKRNEVSLAHLVIFLTVLSVGEVESRLPSFKFVICR